MDCRRLNHHLAHGTSLDVIKDNVIRNHSPSYFERLGTAIGNSTLLRELEFCGGVTGATDGHEAFFRGLKRNASITTLTLRECNLSESAALGLLSALAEEGCNLAANLENMHVYNCSVGNVRGAVALAKALGNCTNMTGLELTQTDVSQWLWELVPGLRACRSITSLNLGGVGMPLIDRAGCDALIPLLQDTNSISRIELWIDNTNYGCTKVLAGAFLANSTKVESLGLRGNVGMRFAGWDAFSRLLCDTSSIEKTYRSNHSLYFLGGDLYDRIPDNVSALLRINSRLFHKKQIAIQKILLYHPGLGVTPFFEWEMKVLPTALDWLDRARPLARGVRVDIDAMRLRVIYQFIRGLLEALERHSTGGQKGKLNE